ncbi:MAG TPA: MogA/MoaB family molybdenum cofactor biosynthesis protein [Bryobacteraceae bacterium]|jgi:molybdenum cofactor synthesis domain-containing protein|nr:MogA/MoaB family molybdenum cofactor biosynthesis protein [Bryobacteraceae bacterium]
MTANGRIDAVIVTVSDSCARGQREDRSGPALRARAEELGWAVRRIHVVPDVQASISYLIRELSDAEAPVILTTGGTGISARDVTPEAVRAILDKEIPGLGERMRAEGLKSTPLAPLSRSLGGTRGSTLILCLPGSPRGAVESFDAVAHLVPHILDLLRGRTAHGSGGGAA